MESLPKEGRGQLSYGRVEARCGRIKLSSSGTHVSLRFCFLVSLHANGDPAWFRLFVGDLSNDVSDDVLANAFNRYPSFQKARVIRDRLSQKVTLVRCIISLLNADGSCVKAKYGFVAFSDPEDFLKAWKEMDGRSTRSSVVKLHPFK